MAPNKRSAVWLVVFMWGAYFLNYCDRQAVFAMFPALKADLQFTDGQLGLIGSVFLWVYGCGCPIAGWMADRYSKRWLVVGSLAIWSVVTTATGLVQSVTMLLGLRAAMGISESLYMPAAVSLTANAYPAHQRSRAVATLTTAQIVGTVAGAWFGGWMANQGQWRIAFFVLGAVGLLYSVPYYLFLRKMHEQPVDEVVHSLGEPHSAVENSLPNALVTLNGIQVPVLLFTVPSFLLLCFVFPVFVFGLWMIYAWFPTFLNDKFNLDMAQAGFTSSIYLQPAMLIGLLTGGVLADKLFVITRAARLWLLTLSLIVCAPCLHFIGNSASLQMTCVAAAGFGLLGGFFAGNIFPAAFEIVPARSRASAVGWLNFFASLVSGFAPLLGGLWKKSLGIDGLLTYTSWAYVLAAICLVIGIKTCYQQDYSRVH